MKNTIDNAKAFLVKQLKDSGRGHIAQTTIHDEYISWLVAYTDTIIQSETAPLRSEIASLRSRLDDCKRKAITGERI